MERHQQLLLGQLSEHLRLREVRRSEWELSIRAFFSILPHVVGMDRMLRELWSMWNTVQNKVHKYGGLLVSRWSVILSNLEFSDVPSVKIECVTHNHAHKEQLEGKEALWKLRVLAFQFSPQHQHRFFSLVAPQTIRRMVLCPIRPLERCLCSSACWVVGNEEAFEEEKEKTCITHTFEVWFISEMKWPSIQCVDMQILRWIACARSVLSRYANKEKKLVKVEKAMGSTEITKQEKYHVDLSPYSLNCIKLEPRFKKRRTTHISNSFAGSSPFYFTFYVLWPILKNTTMTFEISVTDQPSILPWHTPFVPPALQV